MNLPVLQDLSKEQLEIYGLPLKGTYLVSGPPGTGKSVMAVYRAQMQQERAPDVQVRLLMFNNTLKSYTSGAAESQGVGGAVETFHRWLPNAYRSWAGESIPRVSKWSYDWDRVVPRVIMSPPPAEAKPFLLIDEGQDLPPGFYTVVRLVTDSFTVFADENQTLTEDNSTLTSIRDNARIGSDDEMSLKRNYRNTREIAELARVFYTGLATGMPELPTKLGDRPVLKRTRDIEEAADYIARYEGNHPLERVGVLVPDTATLDEFDRAFARRGLKNKHEFYSSKQWKRSGLDFSRPGIKMMCYQSAKGLEFDAVFIPELQRFQGDRTDDRATMQLYVLISRARERLYLTYSGHVEPAIIADLPPDLIEQQL